MQALHCCIVPVGPVESQGLLEGVGAGELHQEAQAEYIAITDTVAIVPNEV